MHWNYKEPCDALHRQGDAQSIERVMARFDPSEEEEPPRYRICDQTFYDQYPRTQRQSGRSLCWPLLVSKEMAEIVVRLAKGFIDIGSFSCYPGQTQYLLNVHFLLSSQGLERPRCEAYASSFVKRITIITHLISNASLRVKNFSRRENP